MGEPDVNGMLKRMPSSAFTEWMAYDLIEPIGPARIDAGFGLVAATVVNVNRKRGRRAIKPIEMYPPYDKAFLKAHPGKQTWQDQLSIVEMLNVAYRGKDLRGNRA